MAPDTHSFDDVTRSPSLTVDSIAGAARSYLLVFDGETSTKFQLPPSGVVVIGRGAEVELQIKHPSVSRRHTQISCSLGEVQVADLGSRNGTRLNGEVITGARGLASGDVVSVGQVTLVFHRDRRPPTARAVVDLELLGGRLEEEVDRSLRYQRPLSIVALDLGASASRNRPFIANACREILRLIDVVAWASETQLMVLMPETSAEAAPSAVERLLNRLQQVAPDARGGFATCPGDGCDIDTLLAAARDAAHRASVGRVAAAAQTATSLRVGGNTIVLADPAMIRIFALIERLALSELPVLVSGETGVGKEIAATALHTGSPRAAKPLVAINCAALQDTLVESELFGHEKGAFSGASEAKPGRLEKAAGGTVFLDEVGELSLAAQAKLLRVLEAKRLSRVGSVVERDINVRIVAATNRNLDEDVGAGRFRRDLYFRLSAATVVLPPLRDRPRDLPILARTFLAEACRHLSREEMTISPAAMQALAAYEWPGNVRELKNLMEYAAAAVHESTLEPWHMPERVTGPTRPSGDEPTVANEGTAAPAAESPPSETLSATAGTGPLRNIYDEIADLEKRRIREALELSGGVQTRAAELIGMPLRTFVTKVKQYEIAPQRPSPRGRSTR